MSSKLPARRPLHERNHSQSNVQAIRLVPSTPPQLLGQTSNASAVRPILRNEIYSRTPLPTQPSHVLSHGKGKTRSSFTFVTPVSDGSFHIPTTPQESPRSTGTPDNPRHPPLHPARDTTTATGSPSTKRKAPSKKRLQIHKDGRTFSLLHDDARAPEDGSSIPQISSPASTKSFDSLPSYASNTEPRTSGISTSYVTEADSTLTTVPGTPPAEPENKLSADLKGTSPWNYSLVGGVRKVPKTPDPKQESVSSESPLPTSPSLPEVSDGFPSPSRDLNTKLSFQSSNTVSTASENSNYKVYRSLSLPRTDPTLETHLDESNYQIINESSPDTTVIHRPQETPSENDYEFPSSDFSRNSSVVRRPQIFNSQANYEVHGSPSTSELSLAFGTHYSHESLVVPALNSKAHRSNERLGYYKSRSRESLRSRAGSITSITTVLSQKQALRAVLSSGLLVNHLPPSGKAPNSWAEPSHNLPQRSYMNEHPHQWSSQLSTVLSVSDGGSGRNSRAWSDATGGRSSGPSRQGRAVYSIGSSSFAPDDYRQRADLPSTPQAAHTRNAQRHLSSSSVPIVESQDEHGDGITDMRDLRTRPSRRRLSGYYSIEGSEPSRTNTMRSTSSSMTTTVLANTLPTWARLYYGSGERRYLGALGAPGSSTEGTDSRSNSFRNRSPSTAHLPLGIYSPRRRPRDSGPHPGRRVATGSMEIAPVAGNNDNGPLHEGQYASRLRTWSMSSVWSPHLRLDRRAQRQSVWEAPSINWSTEGGWFGRRNIQIVMFIVGFIFPFAWMAAGLLPLPPRPLREMRERDNSTSNLGVSNDDINDYELQFGPMDEARYESAKWWRRINRGMSLVGALLIAVIIVLVVVSLREGW